MVKWSNGQINNSKYLIKNRFCDNCSCVKPAETDTAKAASYSLQYEYSNISRCLQLKSAINARKTKKGSNK